MVPDSAFILKVKELLDQSRRERGGVKKLIEATGKSRVVLHHWSTGRSDPKREDKVDFLSKAEDFVSEQSIRIAEQQKRIDQIIGQ